MVIACFNSDLLLLIRLGWKDQLTWIMRKRRNKSKRHGRRRQEYSLTLLTRKVICIHLNVIIIMIIKGHPLKTLGMQERKTRGTKGDANFKAANFCLDMVW